MKVDITGDIKNTEQLFLEKMQKEGVADIGCNPSLIDIIRNTWKWPVVKAFYFLDSQPAAFLSAVKIRKKWVALPHFDHGSLWVSHQLVNQSHLARRASYEKEIHHFLYRLFIRAMVGEDVSLRKSYAFSIHLSENPETDLQLLRSDKTIQLVCRSHFPILNYHIDNKVIPVVQLAETPLLQMQHFSGNVRRKINKSRLNGFTLQTGGQELLEDFYQVYRSNIQRLGSLGLPGFFFKNLIRFYQHGQVKIFIAYHHGIPAGASILLTFHNRAENGWFSSKKAFNRLYVTYFLHAAMMEYAIKAGCSTYSFGRSTKNSTGHVYKQQWATNDMPLYVNSIRKLRDPASGYPLVRRLLRWVPKQVASWLDGPVSQMIY